jgi:hypothetical protein
MLATDSGIFGSVVPTNPVTIRPLNNEIHGRFRHGGGILPRCADPARRRATAPGGYGMR